MKTLLPAYPLISVDPYFSYWSFSSKLNSDDVRHWTGKKKAIKGIVFIDDETYSFLGYSNKRIKQVSHNVTPLINEYVFRNDKIELVVKFYSPLILDDPTLCSRPISFIDCEYKSIDGKKHQVKVKMSFGENLTYNDKRDYLVQGDIIKHDYLNIAYMGKLRQPLLEASGDNLRINWGYLFVSADKKTSTIQLINDKEKQIDITINLEESKTAFIMCGYDDIVSINYYGEILKGYWTKKYKNIIEALEDAFNNHNLEYKKCLEVDQEILDRAFVSGGEELQKIAVASYRQSIAAHKMVIDHKGRLLFISKENFSNGCAATVDVSYPSIPLYLIYNPELVLGMCRPIIDFARMEVWPFDFAPHDAGRYPVLNGNAYGLKMNFSLKGNETHLPYYLYKKDESLFDFNMQMPVEESANMLIMIYSACKLLKNKSFILENMDLFNRWVKYLIEFGQDPGNQLCTDDFAGHLEHNANLAAKSILGIEAFALMNRFLRNKEEYVHYHSLAKSYAKEWEMKAFLKDHTFLNFGNKESWSLKYNLIWDKYFNSHLFSKKIINNEIKYYLKKQNKFGTPLDSRKDYTKSDWLVWSSSLTDDINKRKALLKPLTIFLEKGVNKVPFGDWYDTKLGTTICFRARSVQGGCFMPILIDEVKGKK